MDSSSGKAHCHLTIYLKLRIFQNSFFYRKIISFFDLLAMMIRFYIPLQNAIFLSEFFLMEKKEDFIIIKKQRFC